MSRRIGCRTKPEPVPLLGKVKGQAFRGTVGRTNAGFIQTPVIVRSKAFEKIGHQAAVFGRTVRELMPCPVIFTHWDRNVFINVKWCDQPLCEDVNDVVVGVGSIVELDAKRVLPLLCLEQTICERRVENKTLK